MKERLILSHHQEKWWPCLVCCCPGRSSRWSPQKRPGPCCTRCPCWTPSRSRPSTRWPPCSSRQRRRSCRRRWCGRRGWKLSQLSQSLHSDWISPPRSEGKKLWRPETAVIVITDYLHIRGKPGGCDELSIRRHLTAVREVVHGVWRNVIKLND